ncbi:hypothetical protein SeLEV6574_g06170 [Synchytrium endobioticum]|uniref:Uncharacterized protein n=1 Tax=Synchytrium endobioticum TaxID=286115 RepID=A0A507CQ99_9FUNG|nr:hypothetical protein SeLEV6574_g06170 [Synchytrium endobioticum]
MDSRDTCVESLLLRPTLEPWRLMERDADLGSRGWSSDMAGVDGGDGGIGMAATEHERRVSRMKGYLLPLSDQHDVPASGTKTGFDFGIALDGGIIPSSLTGPLTALGGDQPTAFLANTWKR